MTASLNRQLLLPGSWEHNCEVERARLDFNDARVLRKMVLKAHPRIGDSRPTLVDSSTPNQVVAAFQRARAKRPTRLFA